MPCEICHTEDYWKIKDKNICVNCQSQAQVAKIVQYCKDHKEEFPNLDPDKIAAAKDDTYTFYKGSPMVEKEREDLDFLLLEYNIPHLLAYIKMGYKPWFWQLLRLIVITEAIPNYEIYTNSYLKEAGWQVELWNKEEET
jgi:hypothetical protein